MRQRKKSRSRRQTLPSRRRRSMENLQELEGVAQSELEVRLEVKFGWLSGL